MTVPRIGEQRVEKAPLPNVRTPTDVPIESVGILPRFDLRGVERAADDYYNREKQKADQIQIMSADAKAAAAETKILYDPETGLLNLKGKNALHGRDMLDEQWKKAMDDIEKDLHSDTQRMAFHRAAYNRFAGMHDTLSRHISTEVERYDNDQTTALINNEGNAAAAAAVRGVSFSDAADRSTMAIARQRAAIFDFAERQGMSNERRDELLSQTTSHTHALVLNRMLANEDDITAKKYYTEFKSELVGQDLITAEKAIETGSLRGESQRLADDILTKHPDDREGAVAAVKKITDPQLRDATETRVVHEFELKSALQRETENDLYTQAANLIEPLVKKGTPFIASDAIPANVWDKLPVAARNALERRALHSDADYPNDVTKWHDFLELTPAQLGQLNQSEFESKYWTHFDRETRLRSELMWANARDAERTGKHDVKMAADESFRDLIKMSLGNVDPVYVKKQQKELTQEQYKFYTDFTVEAMRRKEQAEIGKGKPLTRAEMQDVMDQLMMERVFIDRGHWHRDTVRLPGEVSKDERNNAYVPLASIPDSVQNNLRSMAPGASKRKIERLYAARLLNDRALFNSILKEK